MAVTAHHKNLHKRWRATYWTFTLIGLIFSGILGYAIGYTIRWESDTDQPIVTTESDTPDIDPGKQLFDNQVLESLRPEADAEAADVLNAQPAAIYSVTGSIETITDTRLLVKHPDVDESIRFTLVPGTTFVQLAPDEANRIGNYVPPLATDIPASTLEQGDIVTVYTAEDMQTADVHTVSTVQLLTEYIQ